MKEEVIETIKKIIKRGNVAEVKKEKENIVVVEIKRKVNIKRPLQ